ncbi:hypothetical protein HKD37_08G022187 [Glycine soja]
MISIFQKQVKYHYWHGSNTQTSHAQLQFIILLKHHYFPDSQTTLMINLFSAHHTRYKHIQHHVTDYMYLSITKHAPDNVDGSIA